LIIALVVVGGVFLLSRPPAQKISVNQNSIVATSSLDLIKNATEIDSDKDGLKDWEESLWKTDLMKVDTDSDGTTDGEEVRLGRNPKLKAPNDKLATSTSATIQNDPHLTKTDKVSRELFAKYLELKQSGSALDQTTQQEFISSVIDNSYLSYKQYSVKDIVVSSDNSEAAFRAYATGMGLAINTHSIKEENEGIIVKRSVEREDRNEIKKLDNIVRSYENILNASLKIPVPKDAINIHLAVLNSYSDIIMTIKGMRVIFEDPFTAIQAVSHYQVASRGIFNAFLSVKKLYENKKIFFQKDEAGYVFTHIL
jgi:hypothetical protein